MIVFAAIGVSGFSIEKGKLKDELGKIYGLGTMLFLGVLLQIIVGVVFSILVISNLYPDINYGFAMILVAGFAGGHGTAAAIGSTFADLGWADATDLGMTSATVGILSGIFVGLILIKWASRNGHTHFIKDFSQIDQSLRTGLIPAENRKIAGEETVSSMAVDSLAWHLSWVLVASGAGYMVCRWIKATFHYSIPDFLCTFLAGFFMFLVFSRGKKGGAYQYFDTRFFSRISGTATDYLVFFGVASIKVSIIVEYAVPLLMLMIVGILLNIVVWRVMSPTLMRDYWFERSMLPLGMAFGVSATGIILLRIVDPDGRSKTLNDFAIANPFISPVQSFLYAVGPAMLLSGGHWSFVAINLGITLALLVVARIFGWWYSKVPLSVRKPQ